MSEPSRLAFKMEYRNGDLECLLLDKTQQPVLKRGFIKYILFIQFMESFSFTGLSSVLEILLLENLQYSENAATEIVHVVLMGEFFASFVGSILCDGFVGKYKAIFIFAALELTGEALLLLLACIPNAQLQNSSVCQAFLLFALMMISLGHGSAIPCLATFGGDEVRQSEAKLSGDVVESRRCVTPTQQFFSAFFLCGMIATILGSIFLPVIRDQSKGSYFIVFLVVLCAKASGIIVFRLGRKEYSSVSTVSTAPGLNGGPDVLADANTSSIQLVTKHSILSKKISREDWTLLTPTIIVMLPKTLFHALDSQVISTWVYQARQMDRRVSGLTIPPDVMPALKNIFVAMSIPLLDEIIYPFVDKHFAKVTNLRKCCLAMMLTTISFVLAGGIQLLIDTDLNEQGGTQSDLSVLWQWPPLLASALGEVMMTIAIIDWIYTESPNSLKAFGHGVSLAMAGLGNLLTLMSVALLGGYAAKAEGSFFFVGVGALGSITQAILAHFYVPRETRARAQLLES